MSSRELQRRVEALEAALATRPVGDDARYQRIRKRLDRGTATARDFDFLFRLNGISSEFREGLIALAVRYACGQPVYLANGALASPDSLRDQYPAPIGAQILAVPPGADVPHDLRSVLGEWGNRVRRWAHLIEDLEEAVKDWVQEEWILRLLAREEDALRAEVRVRAAALNFRTEPDTTRHISREPEPAGQPPQPELSLASGDQDAIVADSTILEEAASGATAENTETVSAAEEASVDPHDESTNLEASDESSQLEVTDRPPPFDPSDESREAIMYWRRHERHVYVPEYRSWKRDGYR